MEALSRIPSEPPSVSPLPDQTGEENRPLWSVMIPAYNCAQYLPNALESVLRQDPGQNKMEIMVCDDASSDADIEQLVHRVGNGRIGYFRQKENVGSLRNFETCLNKSRGELIHLLHGDDGVRAGFYEHMERLFLQHADMGMAFCRFFVVDQYTGTSYMSPLEMETEGILNNWLEQIASRQRIQTPSAVVRRSVYEKLGGFYAVHYGEDWEMWIRIAAHYKVGYIPLPLADYRKHESSITGRYILTGQNVDDLKKVMEISKQYFTPERWESINKAAREFYAELAISTARKIWGTQLHKAGTKMQVRKSLSLSPNRKIVYQAFKLYFKMFLNIKR